MCILHLKAMKIYSFMLNKIHLNGDIKLFSTIWKQIIVLKFQKMITPGIRVLFSHWYYVQTLRWGKLWHSFQRTPSLECNLILPECFAGFLPAETISSGITKNRFHFMWVSVTADIALFGLLVLSPDTYPFEEPWFMKEAITVVSVPADNTPTAFVPSRWHQIIVYIMFILFPLWQV